MHPLFRGTNVIPVLSIERERDAVPLARALFEGGLSVLEVTFRTEAAQAAIEAIARDLPQVMVGAGTLLRAADVAAAVKAGAKFSRQSRHDAAARRRRACHRSAVSARRGDTLRDHGGAGAGDLRDEAVSGRGDGRRRYVARACASLSWRRVLPDGRDRRTARRTLSGAAQRADGRRLVDGAARCHQYGRLGPHPPPRRARRGDRPARGGLAQNQTRQQQDYQAVRRLFSACFAIFCRWRKAPDQEVQRGERQPPEPAGRPCPRCRQPAPHRALARYSASYMFMICSIFKMPRMRMAPRFEFPLPGPRRPLVATGNLGF